MHQDPPRAARPAADVRRHIEVIATAWTDAAAQERRLRRVVERWAAVVDGVRPGSPVAFRETGGVVAASRASRASARAAVAAAAHGSPAAGPLVLLAECDGSLAERAETEAAIRRLLAGVPGAEGVRVRALPIGRLSELAGGRTRRPAARRGWIEHVRRWGASDVEPKRAGRTDAPRPGVRPDRPDPDPDPDRAARPGPGPGPGLAPGPAAGIVPGLADLSRHPGRPRTRPPAGSDVVRELVAGSVRGPFADPTRPPPPAPPAPLAPSVSASSPASPTRSIPPGPPRRPAAGDAGATTRDDDDDVRTSPEVGRDHGPAGGPRPWGWLVPLGLPRIVPVVDATLRAARRRLVRAGAVVGPGVAAWEPLVLAIAHGAVLRLERNVVLMPGVEIVLDRGAALVLGEGTVLGPGVRIRVRAGLAAVGPRTRFGAGSEADVRAGLLIGRAVLVDPGVRLIDAVPGAPGTAGPLAVPDGARLAGDPPRRDGQTAA